MSYILDALKKKNPEQDDSAIPNISSEHAYQQYEKEQPFVRWLWPIVVMILVLTIGILAFMLMNPSAETVSRKLASHLEETTKDTQFVPSQTAAEKDLYANDEPRSGVEFNKRNDSMTISNKPLEISTPVVTRQVSQVEKAQSQESLEATSQHNNASNATVTQQDLPTLIYTAHIYATQSKDRFVMLNGEAFSEGDAVTQDLRIKTILENDLVVIFKGQEFVLPSLEDVNTK